MLALEWPAEVTWPIRSLRPAWETEEVPGAVRLGSLILNAVAVVVEVPALVLAGSRVLI